MHSPCGLIKVDLVMEPPAQPYPGYSGGSCSVILASGHHGLAQSRRDLLENGSTFLGPNLGLPIFDEREGPDERTSERVCIVCRGTSRSAMESVT